MRFVLFLWCSTLAIAGEFTTALGDSYPYKISAITTDSAGNTYVVGSRAIGVPTVAFRIGTSSFSLPAASDIFVSKLDPTGKLLFTDTFAGKGTDVGLAIALDPSGNIYIAGTTTSDDFPLSKALQTTPNSTYGTGFIIKLSNDGSTILYSTYFGGTFGPTSITSLATDSKGNLYLTGTSSAPDFPHTAGMPFGKLAPPSPALPQNQSSGAIIAAISAAGDKILYSGAIAGSAVPNPYYLEYSQTTGAGIAVDAAGNAYVAGNTNTTDLATTAGTISPKGFGAFVAKFAPTGLSYLTYLSAGKNQSLMSPAITPANILNAIAVDPTGNAYLAGSTTDIAFPTTPGSLQPKLNQPLPSAPGLPPLVANGFLAKLKPDGSGMVWATYLDRSNPQAGSTFPQSIAIDPSGNVWTTGTTGSVVYLDGSSSTGPEFVVGINSTGSAMQYQATFPIGTIGQSVALDPTGFVHMAGVNGFVSSIPPSTPFSMKISYFQNAAGGAATARIAPAELIAIFGPGIGPQVATTATATNGFFPKTLGGVQVTINGINMPLLYVSRDQINAIVPMGIAPGASAIVRVINISTPSPDFPVWIVPAAAQAFAPVLNEDGTLNSTTNPAKPNSTVSFYATGWPTNFAPLADGQIATAPQDSCELGCFVFPGIAENPANFSVTYGGVAPGIVAGVTQFNVHLGTVSNQSEFGLSLNIIGQSSITQTVWLKP